MNSQEQLFLSNVVVLSAIFLDPRFQILLDQNQTDKAIKHLSALWSKIINLKESSNLESDVIDISSLHTSCASSSPSGSDSDEFYLDKLNT